MTIRSRRKFPKQNDHGQPPLTAVNHGVYPDPDPDSTVTVPGPERSDRDGVTVDSTLTVKKGFQPDAGAAAAGAAHGNPPKGGSRAPRQRPDMFTEGELLTIARRGKVNLSDEGIEAFYRQARADEWTLYGRPIERKSILRVLREWSKKNPDLRKAGAVEYEKLEPFTQWQLAKYLENYSGEGDDEDDILDSAWEGVYGILERLFPEEEREKLDSAAIDWDDEKTIREAIKGGYCSRRDFAKDMRQFILTETGVRFPL